MKNTFVKVLSMMMALMMVVGVLTALPVTAAACTHEGTTVADPVDPTCKENGYTRYECTACEEKWVGNIIPASPTYHDWDDVEAESATCTQGSHSAGKVCLTCGEKTYVENNDKLAHVFIKTKTELTCTQDEAYVFVCKLCGHSAEEIYGEGNVPAEYAKDVIRPAAGCNPDNYKWEIVSMPTNGATCVNGLAVGTCAFCGNKENKVLPVQHVWKPVVENVGQACSLYKSGEICKFCSEPNSENPPVANVGGDHSFDYTNSANIVGLNGTLTASGVAGWTFAMFEDIDIFVNDRLSYAPTCTTPGQYIGVCACGEPVKISVPATGHAYGAFNTGVRYGVPGADGKYAETALYTTKTLCVQDGVQTQTCINVNGTTACNAKNYRVVEEGAADHTWEDKVTEPTCYANGFTTTDCAVEGCAFAAYDHTYVDKLTHVYEAPFAQKVTSGGAYCDGKVNWKKGCGLCKKEDGSYDARSIVDATAADLTAAQKAHKYTLTPIPATCTAPAYTVELCDWCQEAKPDTLKVVAGSTPNTSAHDYTEYKKNGDTFFTTGFDNVNWVSDNTKSTCYALGQSVWTCKRCDNIKVDTSATYAGHTDKSNWAGKAENGTAVNVKAETPTCQANGWEAGTACEKCGRVATQRKVIKNDLNDYRQHFDVKEVASGSATCTTLAYKTYTTSCHGVITITSGTYASHNYYKVADDPATEANEAVYNYVTFKAPSCEATGNHRYVKCVNCNNVLPGSVDGVGCTLVNGVCPYGFDHALLGLHGNTNATIPAIGAHNWAAEDEAGYYDRVEETCDVDGTFAKTTCKVCGKIKVMTDEGDKIFAATETAKIAKAEKILKHGTYYKRYVAPVDATCTQEGVRANEATGNMWCTKCMNKFDNPETEDVVEGYRVHKEAHNYTNRVNINWTGTAVKNCMEPYGWVDTCSVCGDVLAYTHAELNDKDDHVWENKALSSVVGATCTTGGYREYECTLCPAKKQEEKVGPAKHYEEKDGVKNEFDLSCIEISKYDGKYCFACGYIVDASGKKVDDDAKNLHYLHATHNEVPKSQNATCSQDGFNIVYCADCGKTLVNDNYVAAYGHDYNTLVTLNKVEYVIEDTAAYVDYVCGFCGQNQRFVKPTAPADDIEIVLGDYNQLTVAGTKYTDSSVIAITVALNAEQAIGASAINLNITYSDNLVFVGKEFAKDIPFAALQDAVDNNDDYTTDKGVFVEGERDFVSITAATEFDIGKAPVDYVVDGELQLVTLFFRVNNEEDTDPADLAAKVQVTKAEIVNAKDETLTVTLDNYAEYVIDVDMFMDCNGNNDITVGDLLIAMQLYSEQKYDVTADVDKDGEITAADLLTIMNYINGAITYEEVAALTSDAE